MTPFDLISHFYRTAPWLTKRFSKTADILSARTVSEGGYFNIEMELSDASDIGRYLHLSGGRLRNKIISTSNIAPSVWKIETEHPHCLSEPIRKNDNRVVVINGKEAVFTEIPDRKHIICGITDEPIGYIEEPVTAEIGYCKVISVSGNSVIAQANKGYLYETEIIDLIAATRLYVALAKDVSIAGRLIAELPEDKCYALIIMGDRETIKKGRHALVVDATDQNVYQHLDISSIFSIVVVWPSADIYRQTQHMTEGFGEIETVMNRLYYGAALSGLGEARSIVPVANGLAEVNDKANYAHIYEYQAILQISMPENGFKEEYICFNVPARDAGFDDFYIQTGDSAPIPLTINLDENT